MSGLYVICLSNCLFVCFSFFVNFFAPMDSLFLSTTATIWFQCNNVNFFTPMDSLSLFGRGGIIYFKNDFFIECPDTNKDNKVYNIDKNFYMKRDLREV